MGTAEFDAWVLGLLAQGSLDVNTGNSVFLNAGAKYFPAAKDKDAAVKRRLNKLVEAGALSKFRYHYGSGGSRQGTRTHQPTHCVIYALAPSTTRP